MLKMNVKILERDVLNPLAEKEYLTLNSAIIPETITEISLFDNTKPNADIILRYIEDNFNGIKFSHVKKPAGAPATLKQINKAAQADLSILALGDCGSCTTWVILDAIKLEKKGIPTISICSDKFTEFAAELASSNGMENLRILEVEHPIAGLSKEKVQEKTLKILPKLENMLGIEY